MTYDEWILRGPDEERIPHAGNRSRSPTGERQWVT